MAKPHVKHEIPKFEHEFYIIPKSVCNVIIRLYLLKSRKAFINFESNTLTFPEANMICPLVQTNIPYLQAVKEITIP